MEINVSIVVPEKDFPIRGASYIGAPRSNTAMFITKKVAHLLTSLESVAECLVFAEEGIDVPESLRKQHAFSFSRKPQLAYARFANQFAEALSLADELIMLPIYPAREQPIPGVTSEMILEKDLDGDRLVKAIDQIMNDKAKQYALKEAASKLGKPNACRDIYQEILRLVEK